MSVGFLFQGSKMYSRVKCFAIVVFLFLGGGRINAYGLASFSIYPTKIILSENQKSASVTLTNQSESSVSYRIRFVEMGIAGNGDMVELGDEFPEGFKSAAKHIRISPRQVRLMPGESQVVRLLLKKRANLDVGEYRSHLEFRVLPDVSNEDVNKNIESFDLPVTRSGLKTNLGSTMPVVVQIGDLNANVNISSMVFERKDNHIGGVKFTVDRMGEVSVFGDISVKYSFGGETREVAKIRGYGLFHPYDKENIVVKFQPIPMEYFNHKGKVEVLFSNASNFKNGMDWFKGEVDWNVVND